MEYHISKDMSVATRIFEFGWQNMAKTADDETTTKYAEEYLNFLIGLNDDNSKSLLCLPFRFGLGSLTD